MINHCVDHDDHQRHLSGLADSPRAAEALNRECLCNTLDPERLREHLDTAPSLQGMTRTLEQTHPHLFSKTAVFLDAAAYATLERSIAAIERVVALPAYRHRALQKSSTVAAQDFGPTGVFMGYDFHVGTHGPRLIEINTNAGGALLNTALASAQGDCCGSVGPPQHPWGNSAHLDSVFMDMFRCEWQSQRGNQALRTVLIIDDMPTTQFLAPEFELTRQLFQNHGLLALIADPQELDWRNGALWHPALPSNLPVDLVYNRLTDFDLSDPTHSALRAAYVSGATVVTPNPRAHALLAHKSNLITLSDDVLLADWGVDAGDRALLQSVVPNTVTVTPATADALWDQRRDLFFKPAAGYGAKAAYRGDKLTRRVWADIVAGDFIAQSLVPPGERLVDVAGLPTLLKHDIRAYSYRGDVQLLAARTYRGQTTNMRTPGGGFSPVLVVPSPTSTRRVRIANPAASA
jgi:hypothetical protein